MAEFVWKFGLKRNTFTEILILYYRKMLKNLLYCIETDNVSWILFFPEKNLKFFKQWKFSNRRKGSNVDIKKGYFPRNAFLTNKRGGKYPCGSQAFSFMYDENFRRRSFPWNQEYERLDWKPLTSVLSKKNSYHVEA